MNTALTLVIMAAGLGSRFGGDKQLAALGPRGEPMLVLSIASGFRAGFKRVVLVIRPELEGELTEILTRFLPAEIEYHFCYQSLTDLPEVVTLKDTRHRLKPWGTAHALWCARHLVPGPMAVINADDFYGDSAFALLAKGLQAQPLSWRMVAYPLQLTLSEHGGVNRGVCQVTGGLLQSVVEWHNIQAVAPDLPEGRVHRAPAGTARAANGGVDGVSVDAGFVGDGPKGRAPLCASALVSMTCWGFSGAIFTLIEAQLRQFIEAQGLSPTAECYLPAIVQAAIEQGQQVQVDVASEPWLGVTYPQDTVWVKQKLMELLSD
ncbi:MAG: NTP transferase domain-containing protein [Shewanella sp.]